MTPEGPGFPSHQKVHEQPIRITLKNAEIDGKETEVRLNKAFEIILGEIYRSRIRKKGKG